MRVVPGVGDADYLAAGDVTGPTSERIGRFIPNHFSWRLNAPLFTTACTAGGFTYQGQSFGYATAPVITATARRGGRHDDDELHGCVLQARDHDTLTGVRYASPAARSNVAGLPLASVDPAVDRDSAAATPRSRSRAAPDCRS